MPPIWRWRNLNSHVPFFHISLIRINNISNIQYIFQFITPPSVLETLYKLFIFEWYIIYDWSKTTTLSLNLASVFLFFADRKSEPLLRPDAKDHSQADKKDKLSAKSKSSAVDSFLQQSTAAIGEGCRQQQRLPHNKIIPLILFLLVHWVLKIV